MPARQASYGWFFSNATKAELRHECLNSDTCHRFEQRLAPARGIQSQKLHHLACRCEASVVLDARNMVR
jgi:hypothetical protein